MKRVESWQSALSWRISARAGFIPDNLKCEATYLYGRANQAYRLTSVSLPSQQARWPLHLLGSRISTNEHEGLTQKSRGAHWTWLLPHPCGRFGVDDPSAGFPVTRPRSFTALLG